MEKIIKYLSFSFDFNPVTNIAINMLFFVVVNCFFVFKKTYDRKHSSTFRVALNVKLIVDNEKNSQFIWIPQLKFYRGL